MGYKTANKVGVSGRGNIGRTTTATKGFIFDGGRGIHVPMNPSAVRFTARENAAVLVIVDQLPEGLFLQAMQWESEIEGSTLPAQGGCVTPIVSDVSDESIRWAPIWLGNSPWSLGSPEFDGGPNMMIVPLITNIGFALMSEPEIEDPMDPWEGPPYRSAEPRAVVNEAFSLMDMLVEHSAALEATVRYTPVHNYRGLPETWFAGNVPNFYPEPW